MVPGKEKVGEQKHTERVEKGAVLGYVNNSISGTNGVSRCFINLPSLLLGVSSPVWVPLFREG